jgi:glycerol-3-phosphate cytidylyltransferase
MSVKIGFTVGVWDLFHEGHLNLLKEAKKHCDYLYVGIMTDYWVRVQKSHDRPIESLEQRLVSLKTCNLVDKIVILDTLDMTPYLQMVDVWIKGKEQKNMRPLYWPNEIYIERTPNISTSDLAKKLKELGKCEI